MNHAFPYARFEAQLHWIYRTFIFSRRLKHLGDNSFISPYATLIGMECISVGCNSSIGQGTLIQPIFNYVNDYFTPFIGVGDNVYIGRRCTLSAATEIVVGNGTTVGDHVYIAGGRHGYEDPERGVMSQNLVLGSIRIGPRVWIGYGSFIAGPGDLEIGEHAIVGANSVVTRSVPAFTVVAGSPARPIKRFHPNQKKWIRI